jgi:iron complex transport system substrate-binding protein
VTAACNSDAAPDDVGAASPTTDDDFPRTVDNALGTTEIPRRPEQVAVLDYNGLVDSVVALGLRPAVSLGVPAWVADSADWPTADGTEETAFVNLEALAAARPDLVIGHEYQVEVADTLQDIAPTVLIAEDVVGWQEEAAVVAEATGTESILAELLEAYEERVAGIREALGDDAPTVSLFRPQPDSFIAYSADSIAGQVLADCGVAVVDPPPGEPFGTIGSRCSLERLAELTGERIVVYTYDISDDEFAAIYESQPLWATVPAVAAGAVTRVDGIAWTNFGLSGVHVLLDELEAALA